MLGMLAEERGNSELGPKTVQRAIRHQHNTPGTFRHRASKVSRGLWADAALTLLPRFDTYRPVLDSLPLGSP